MLEKFSGNFMKLGFLHKIQGLSADVISPEELHPKHFWLPLIIVVFILVSLVIILMFSVILIVLI